MKGQNNAGMNQKSGRVFTRLGHFSRTYSHKRAMAAAQGRDTTYLRRPDHYAQNP